MKLVSFQAPDGPAVGLLDTNGVVDLSRAAPHLPRSMKQLLAEHGANLALAVQPKFNIAPLPLEEIEFLPVVPDPNKIICIG